MRREPGEVLAQPADVVVLAGRSVLFDPLQYNFLLGAGQWRAEPLVARICNGEIRLLVIEYSLEDGAAMTFGGVALWPHEVMEALQDTMTLDRLQSDRFIYTPRAATRADAPGAASGRLPSNASGRDAALGGGLRGSRAAGRCKRS